MPDPLSAALAMKALAGIARTCAAAWARAASSGSGGVSASVKARGMVLLFVVLEDKAVKRQGMFCASKVSCLLADLSVGALGVAQSDAAYRVRWL